MQVKGEDIKGLAASPFTALITFSYEGDLFIDI